MIFVHKLGQVFAFWKVKMNTLQENYFHLLCAVRDKHSKLANKDPNV